MHQMLLIESAVQGVLFINGQFCGPMETEGQAFPLGNNAEIYIQLFPFGEAAPLTVQLHMRGGRLARLEPKESAYALVWPDGIVQLELRMREQPETAPAEEAAFGTLLRYLSLRLADDPQAQRLWLNPQEERNAPDLSGYRAVVPLRFAPTCVPERFDDRAGLVHPVSENMAVIDAAMAVTAPAGQGRRLIESISILQTARNGEAGDFVASGGAAAPT